jgi:hypothetical protein
VISFPGGCADNNIELCRTGLGLTLLLVADEGCSVKELVITGCIGSLIGSGVIFSSNGSVSTSAPYFSISTAISGKNIERMV